MKIDNMFAPVGSLNLALENCLREHELSQSSAIWMPDHLLGNNMHPDLAPEALEQPDIKFDYWHDPFIALMALTQKVPRGIDFGICVTDLIRRGPVDVARAAATFSQAVGRPLLLGVGAGEKENLEPADYTFPGKPVALFEERLGKLRGLLDTGIYESDSGYRVDFGYNELPAKIYIGGQGPRMLRLTAQCGDGWLPAWKMSAEEYSAKVETIKYKAAEFSRPCPDLCLFIPLIIGRSRSEIYAEMRRRPLLRLWGLTCSHDAWKKHGVQHPYGPSSNSMHDIFIRKKSAQELRQVAMDMPPEIVGEGWFVGNAEELYEEIKPYRDAGMQRAVTINSYMVPPRSEDAFIWCQKEYQRLTTTLRKLD